MKKKLYDFFFYEKIEMIEVMDEEKKQRQPKRVEPNERNIETKVVYEYPDKRNFRFPIIPDYEQKEVHKRDETLEIPTYMRKERTSDRLRSRLEDQEEQLTEKHVEMDKQHENKVSVRSTRFVPTDVPSPIYGYNRRTTERDLRNTPAYIRRDMRSEHEESKNDESVPVEEDTVSSLTSQVKKERSREPEEHILQETHTMDNEPTLEPTKESTQSEHIHQQGSEMVANTRSEESVENTIREVPRSTASREEEPKELNNTGTNENHGKQRPTPAPKKSNETPQPDTPDIPFNVMMTRQDKVRYQRQQEKQQSNIQQETHIQQPSKSFVDADQVDYSIPMHLLNDPMITDETDNDWLIEQRNLLEETFVHFNVDATVVNVTQGPSVTRFEVQPALGVKVSKVRNLSDDIKLNLSAKDIRIEAPIPGKNTIGIEIPNLHSQTVGLYEILHDPAFT
ncbi:MAG TPA: DNA translocase FtsK, partial [Bacillota bacterium]|nr:DNA translocase FtsK [Bacillota bacterium]